MNKFLNWAEDLYLRNRSKLWWQLSLLCLAVGYSGLNLWRAWWGEPMFGRVGGGHGDTSFAAHPGLYRQTVIFYTVVAILAGGLILSVIGGWMLARSRPLTPPPPASRPSGGEGG